MAKIKNEDVVPVAEKLITYYTVDGEVIAVYDDDFDEDWLTDFVAQKDLVSGLEIPKGLTDDMAGDTLSCNDNMDLMSPMLVNLKYKVKKCIRLHTITATLASFYISELNASINVHDFEKFSFYYHGMKELIDVADNNRHNQHHQRQQTTAD